MIEAARSLIPDGIWQIAVPHKRTPYTIALEVDCGTLTDQWKWRRKIAGYLAVLAGALQTDSYPDFLTDNLTIAIIAVPGAKRMNLLREWTYAELAARGGTDCPNFSGCNRSWRCSRAGCSATTSFSYPCRTSCSG
jgi:hypothetical protein